MTNSISKGKLHTILSALQIRMNSHQKVPRVPLRKANFHCCFNLRWSLSITQLILIFRKAPFEINFSLIDSYFSRTGWTYATGQWLTTRTWTWQNTKSSMTVISPAVQVTHQYVHFFHHYIAQSQGKRIASYTPLNRRQQRCFNVKKDVVCLLGFFTVFEGYWRTCYLLHKGVCTRASYGMS